MVGRGQLRYGYGFPTEFTNRLDALGPEQLEASGMDPAQEHDRHARVHLNDEGRNEGHADVNLTSREAWVWIGPRRLEILDVGKPFSPEQLFGYVLRRNADARNLHEANGGGFRWRLLRKTVRPADQAGG